MAQQLILYQPVGSGLGDPAPTAAAKINANFSELYGSGAVSANQSPWNADPTNSIDATAGINTFLAAPGLVKTIPAGTYKISGPLFVAQAGTQLTILGTLQATTSFTPASGSNFVLNVTGAKCTVWTPVIDGAVSGNVNVADGIIVSGTGSVVYFPQVTHCPTACINLNATDGAIYQPYATQWNSGDFQFNPNNGSFYTADAILISHPDNLIVGGISRWAKNCVHITSGAGTNNIIGHHMYNGTSAVGVARVDPVCVLIDAGCPNSVWFSSPYFDNGHVKVLNGGISIRDGFYLTNAGSSFTADTDGNQNAIQVYANGQIQPFMTEMTWRQVSLNSGQKLIAMLASVPPGNTWTGDYTGIPQLLTTPYQTVLLSPGEVLIQTEEQSYPAVIPTQGIYKSGGTISIVYQIGATGSPMVLQIDNTHFGFSGPIGVNGATAPTQVTGWGTPVGPAVINNYNISDAGGANSNTNKAVAQIIKDLKALGVYGA